MKFDGRLLHAKFYPTSVTCCRCGVKNPRRTELYGLFLLERGQTDRQTEPMALCPHIETIVWLKDPRLRESLMVGATDCPLEDKMVTIAYGIDMVNISYISFAATTKAIAQVL